MAPHHPIFDRIETIDDDDAFLAWAERTESHIGRVIMESTALEDELEMALYDWLYAGDDSLVILLEGLSFFKKIETISRIVEKKLSALPTELMDDHENSLSDEWTELSNRLEIARKARNQVAHGSWLRRDRTKGVKVGVKRKKGDCEVVFRKLDIKELVEIQNNITWARSILHHFMRRLSAIACQQGGDQNAVSRSLLP